MSQVNENQRNWVNHLQFTAEGLLPAILQDSESNQVLMMGWMNRESLELTLETRQVWFWSRSRQELWHKGATSGHTQQVVSIAYDCDGDTLLLQVKPKGPACHTGAVSCFFQEVPLAQEGIGKVLEKSLLNSEMQKLDFSVLEGLLSTIQDRYENRPEGAYTTYLFDKGIDKIVKKIGEEATEVVVAAKNRDAKELVSEAGDLIYHLLVLLQNEAVPFGQVLEELEQRHGQADIRGKTK